jgi:NAD(P)-dependent dehydrogenase (short-subunit alcohol dehydrogenase family)
MQPVTIITGGSRGIGAATALLLARHGHHVVVGYQRQEQAARAVTGQVAAAGGQSIAVAVDVTDEAAVAALFDAAQERFGTPTGLVNNAGITSPMGPLADIPVADLRRVVEVNVLGALLCAQAAARRLADGGAIVNLSSAAATLGSPGEYVHYAASKGAIDTLTVGLAKELAPRGIRVNAVAPGVIRTEIHATSGEPGRPDRVGPAVPLGRAGEPEEIAEAIAWLLSPAASYTTGAVLRVAGGR